ncbi:MAG: hypothetical protein ABJA79_07940 [Parafilimonas sp.]
MLNQLLNKLIKYASGRSRYVMATAGLSIALLLIFAAVQMQVNYNELLHGKSNQDSLANFLVLNKEVNEKTIGATTLTDAEITDLKKQPFVEEIGMLTPSRFKVAAQSISNRLPFYTDLFFESVPDEFIDVQTEEWKWNENSAFIPMIIPNMFLDMYNFGFATSQNLPQLSQELVKNIPIQIDITTPQGVVNYYGKVVGFSDRISSVLVPQTFMVWANSKFGTSQSAKPSRIVIKTKDAGDPALTDYLNKHGLSTSADKTRFSKYRKVVDTVVNISWLTGAVMLLFALLIFSLFIQLTIASCKEEISLLIILGAAPKQLQQFLMKRFFPPNIIIIIIVIAIIAVLQFLSKRFLQAQNMYVNTFISLYTIAAALLMLIVLWLVNRNAIVKYIQQSN